MGDGRKDDDLGLDSGRHALTGRRSDVRRCLCNVFHEGRVRPLEAIERRVRSSEGTRREGKERGRGQSKGRRIGFAVSDTDSNTDTQAGRKEIADIRLGWTDGSEVAIDRSYLGAFRLGFIERRREAFLPDELR